MTQKLDQYGLELETAEQPAPDSMTSFRKDLLIDGRLISGREASGEELSVSHIALQGVSFRSPKPLSPGSIHHLRASDKTLASTIRVVSCRLRRDSMFDIGAEFF